MKFKNIFLLLLTLFITNFMFTQSHMIITDERKINNLLTKDINNLSFQSPMQLKDSIIFFYKGKAKSVQIAGDFNNWENNLYMVESRTNLWTISLTNRINQGSYRYRIKVDGFWIADPMNPNFEFDIGRQKLSTFTIKQDFTPNKKFPFWVSNNTYLFEFNSTNANIVTIAGDFNNWNPYSHQLKHKGAGTFTIQLDLPPKHIYLYSFIIDGIWTADTNNKKQYRNEQNRPVNAFYANQANSIP